MNLPDEVIDRAVTTALSELPVLRKAIKFPDAVMTKMVLAIAPELVEHGAKAERERIGEWAENYQGDKFSDSFINVDLLLSAIEGEGETNG